MKMNNSERLASKRNINRLEAHNAHVVIFQSRLLVFTVYIVKAERHIIASLSHTHIFYQFKLFIRRQNGFFVMTVMKFDRFVSKKDSL